MQTKVTIVPARIVNGFQMQFYFEKTWNNYGPVHETKPDADYYMNSSAAFERWNLSTVRLVPAQITKEAWPSQDYIEEMWLTGYHLARAGKENNYGPSDNQILIQEGMDAFHAGLKLFA